MTTTGSVRRALVTGAARGIGRSIAERLRTDGMHLTVLDRDPSVERVAADLDGSAIVVDLRDDAATADALAAVDDPFWLLVNNAGVFAKRPLLETDVSTWDTVQETNVRSMLVTMQSVVPGMLTAGGGRIVNVASMAATRGTPGEAAYAASKAAVVALTRIAALEFGSGGVTANSICPGYVLTELGSDTRTPEQIAEWSSQSPLGRLCDPADVAALVSHLASDDAAYITGQALNVTGGMCTW